MSSLPGGAADKAGLIHEALWGVACMLEVLQGRAESICIEEPRVDGAEFYLQRGDVREYWQAKRHVINQENWTLTRLKSAGVLDFFLERVRARGRCVFASISDAPELRLLAENADQAADFDTFQEKFLDGKWKNAFIELCSYWDKISHEDAFNCLKRIRVEGARECTLETFLANILQATFSGPPQAALAILQHHYVASIHRTLTADTIREHLNHCNIKAREFAIGATLRDVLLGITDSYISGQKANLISAQSIPRRNASEILTSLTTSNESLDFLFAGPAGGGKSACLLQIAEGLRSAGMPVLAFRLDRIEPVFSSEALGTALNLPESPAVVLARCFEGQAVALIVDQLDFVSSTSGRHPSFFDTLAALIDEVRGLRVSCRIHLIFACRQFDFENDHRFRRLLPKDSKPVSVDLFIDLEVRTVIKAEGGDPAWLSARQLELLRLPQNLSLFTEAGLAPAKSPGFVSQKELFDAYWEMKRRATSLKRPGEEEQFIRIIQKLTDEMNARQELSVPKARLDEFSQGFLDAMVSEGVLTFDRRCFGFGHESFFDYCYARCVTASGDDFIGLLEKDEQDLFRRAQLRQVLVYLRDADHKQFLKYVSAALASVKIRSHLKLLVLELLASFPNPNSDEFKLLMPYLDSEFECFRQKKSNANKMSTRAFDVFFKSHSLFIVADQLNLLHQWLHSGEPWLENVMALYCRWQINQHADRVAELLEPFADVGGEWNSRLCFVMKFGNLEKGRRLFDLFLRLLDKGVLDTARSSIAVNGTFWSMLGYLAKSEPSWLAELAAHWLDRQVAIALASTDRKHAPSINDDFGVNDIFESARLAPAEYLKYVLPSVLRSANAFAFQCDNSFQRDAIWPYRFHGEHMGLGEAFLSACEEAFGILSKSDPGLLRPYIEQLRPLSLYTANHLLLNGFLTAPVFFAEEALLLIATEPDRLLCGVSQNAHWISKCLIEQCSAFCTQATFEKLESVLINYTTPIELEEGNSAYKGHAAFNLVSALVESRRSPSTNLQLVEWRRRFVAPDRPPQPMRCYTIVSPVTEQQAECFSDEEWLQAIAKYNVERGVPDFENLEKGGASHFASLLQAFLKREPARFANLSLRFSAETHPSYFMNILYAVKDAPLPSALKCEVAKKVYGSDCNACLMAALDILGTISDVPIADDAIDFIVRMSIELPDPVLMPNELRATDRSYDHLGDGINSVRGHAVETIRNLINYDKDYLVTFGSVIERAVSDANLGVRACLATTLFAVAVRDVSMALPLFEKLLIADDSLLTAQSVQRFINAGLHNHLENLRPFVTRMLGSALVDVRRAGGSSACLARLYHTKANDLAEMALAGDMSNRMGAVIVAKDNFIRSDCREWCESKLMLFFNDPAVEIRKEAARCFWYLWQNPEIQLTEFDSLIKTFLSSLAFADDPSYLIHALDDTRQRVPESILDVCEQFVNRCAAQARDIRTSIAGDEFSIGRLVFRAYAQLESTALRRRSLNLIDRMCEEGLQSANKQFSDFER